MGANYRTQNKLILFGIETVSGTEEPLTPAANAILVENPVNNPELQALETNEVTGALDSLSDIPAGGPTGATFDVLLKGSGTGGVAPEAGPAYRACAMAETLLAADESDTAQAGGPSEITLAPTASAVDDFYKGMVINIDSGPGAGEHAVVWAYDGTTKIATVRPAWQGTPPDVTSVYTIYANALYVPASTGLETGTGYEYQHSSAPGGESRLKKIVGAAGTLTWQIATNQIARASFTFTGKLPAPPTDEPHPGDGTFSDPRPGPFLSADAFLNDDAVQFSEFSADLGGQVQQADEPAEQFGVDLAGVVARRVTGVITPYMVSLAVRNPWADFIAGTEHSLWLNWGQVPGNRVSILFPSMQYIQPRDADNQGYAADELSFKANGIDSTVYLCLY